MEFLNSWLQGIIVSVVIATIIEMILPNGNSKKYIKIVLGIYVAFNIITPVVNKITKNNFELSSIVNIDEYKKQMQSIEKSSLNVNTNINTTNINEVNIKQIYISKLENDIKTKLEEKDYIVNNIKIDIENNEEYTIKQIILLLQKNDDTKTYKDNNTSTNTNKYIQINEIEEVDIKVKVNNNSKDKNQTKKEEENKKESNIDINKRVDINKITENDKNEIKKYISSIYNVNENNIVIN